MSGLQLALQQACAKLGLAVDFDRTISLNAHLNITVPAYIVYLGGKNGMLIFTDMAIAWSNRMAIRAAGYGYTVLEDRPIGHVLDMDSFKDMFRDWGWSGPAELKPSCFYTSGPVNLPPIADADHQDK